MKATVRISLDLDLATEQALLREAERHHSTVNELVQLAVDAYLTDCVATSNNGDRTRAESREPSLAEKMSHLRFQGGSPHTLAENHDEFLYPLTGPVKQK